MAKQQWPQVRYSQTNLGGGVTAQGQSYPGGLDLTTPSLRLSPGLLRAGVNFECAQSGGYARIEGYERFDGCAAPSAATFQIIQVATFINVPSVGQTITQDVSGASATIIAVVADTTPAYIAVTRITGTFNTSNLLRTTVTIAYAAPPTTVIGAKTRALYTAAAADAYRALIGAVPGSGAVLGVVGMVFNGVDNVYAFRANVAGTAVALYKASTASWTLVPFLDIVSFSGGTSSAAASPPLGPTDPAYTIAAGSNLVVGGAVTVQNPGGLIVEGALRVTSAAASTIPVDGDTLTQGAVTATIKRVMWQSGAWAGSAAGQFVITTPTGGSFVAGSATTGGGAIVTLSGVQTAVTMAPGGRFEFEKCNFSGQLVTRRIYGCDGVNPCFEFDGETLAPIATGLSPDAPSHIRFHKNFLFVSQDSSLFYCGAGTPFKWGAVDGGGEIATGDAVNGMITLPGSQTTATLAVFLRSTTAFLYGTDPSTFNFVSFNTNIGALPYSAQNLFDTFFLDALGVVTLKTTLNWGNFLPTTLTKNILPFIARERTKLTASAINRAKSQYRLFFNDGYALYCTIINQQYMGAIPQLFPNPIYCADETSLADGTEATYFGSSDGLGYVYQLDKGTSFDGGPINAYLITAWDPVRSPRILKRFRAASIEMQGDGYAEIQFGFQLGYENSQVEQPAPTPGTLNLSQQALWDSMIWDNFVWDGVGLTPSDVDVTGTAENILVTFTSGENYIPAYTLNSVIHQYSLRRGMRV